MSICIALNAEIKKLFEKRRGELQSPNVAHSKQFRSEFMACVNIFKLICPNLSSKFGTEFTTLIALRCRITLIMFFTRLTEFNLFFFRTRKHRLGSEVLLHFKRKTIFTNPARACKKITYFLMLYSIFFKSNLL